MNPAPPVMSVRTVAILKQFGVGQVTRVCPSYQRVTHVSRLNGYSVGRGVGFARPFVFTSGRHAMNKLIRPLAWTAALGVAGVLGSNHLTADSPKPDSPPAATATALASH